MSRVELSSRGRESCEWLLPLAPIHPDPRLPTSEIFTFDQLRSLVTVVCAGEQSVQSSKQVQSCTYPVRIVCVNMCEVWSYIVLMYMPGVLCAWSIMSVSSCSNCKSGKPEPSERSLRLRCAALLCSALCCASIPLCCPSPPVDSTKCQNLPSQLRKFATEISFPSFNPQSTQSPHSC